MKLKIIGVTVYILLIVCSIIQIVQQKSTYEENIVESIYVVSQGDTLWDIAKEYCPSNMDIRDYIYDIKERNDISGTIHNGQVLEVWTTEKPAKNAS